MLFSAKIYNLCPIPLPVESDVFPDPVKYNHGIVYGVTHYGKDGCDKGLVNLQGEMA